MASSDAPPPPPPPPPNHNVVLNDDDLDDVTPHHLHLIPTAMNHNLNFNNPNHQFPRNHTLMDDEEDDVDVDDDDVDEDSTSSTNPQNFHLHHHQPPPPSVPLPTAACVDGQGTAAHPFRDERLSDVTVAAASVTVAVPARVEDKRPAFQIDESRKLFQRLWTDEDEIELLQGFLEYTTQRGALNSSHHHDTTAFYDQIKSKLQLDCNKNQLVEKLRRLKKKYRNVMQKIGSGKEYVFKSPHDQATFEISRKIWSGSGAAVKNSFGGGSQSAAVVDEGGLDDDHPSPNPNPNHNPNPNPNPNTSSGLIDSSPNPNGVDRETQIRSRKRSRVGSGGGGSIPTPQFNQPQTPIATGVPTAATPATATITAAEIPNVIEETVRSCLSPIFKELLNGVMNFNHGHRSIAGLALSPMPLGLEFGGIGGMDFTKTGDERWRKQQILEMEVFLRRLELVQDQIKGQLEELRGKGS